MVQLPSIPPFRDDGYLPEGLYLASEAEITFRFGTASLQRPRGGATVITSPSEYQKAQEDLNILEKRLSDLQATNPLGSKGFTKAGIRKLIARLHEELAIFEGSEEARQSTTTS